MSARFLAFPRMHAQLSMSLEKLLYEAEGAPCLKCCVFQNLSLLRVSHMRIIPYCHLGLNLPPVYGIIRYCQAW